MYNYPLYRILLFLLVLSSVSYIFYCFPDDNDYRIKIDEGIYYKQAKTVLDNGVAGFKQLAVEFIEVPSLQNFPNPLRTGHIISSALLLNLNDSVFMLAFKSWLFFILLIICCWWYIRKIWNEETAFYIVLLLCISPLLAAMSKRALIEMESLFFISLAIFLFLDYIKKPNNKRYYLFIGSLCLSCFFKESAFFVIPFYFAVLLWLKYKDEIKLSFLHLITVIFLPVVSAGFFHLIFFQDLTVLIDLLKTHVFTFSENLYNLQYCSGPWQQYITDFILVSPFVSVMGILFMGYYLLKPKKRMENLVLILLYIYLIFFYAFMPKNIRFLLLAELLLVIFAGFFIVHIYLNFMKSKTVNKVVFCTFLSLLIINGVSSFNHYFVKNNIYDPIGNNIVYAANIITNPKLYKQEKKLKKLKKEIKEQPNVENYVNLSLIYYQKSQFRECIDMCYKVLELDPENATAYNNICSSHNSLGEFNKGAIACEKALQINPEYDLARLNLEYALENIK